MWYEVVGAESVGMREPGEGMGGKGAASGYYVDGRGTRSGNFQFRRFGRARRHQSRYVTHTCVATLVSPPCRHEDPGAFAVVSW